jgi:hypothetical protein
MAQHRFAIGQLPIAPPTRYPPRHEHTTTISGRATNDPRQHARQRRAVARRVLLAVPSPGDPERGPLARSRAGAEIWPAHGVHPVRNHRCRRPAELAGATGAGEPDRRAMAIRPRKMGIIILTKRSVVRSVSAWHLRDMQHGFNLRAMNSQR